jgi:parallel beta-helix repeat protein
MLNVHRVEASETITINADGSLSPPTSSISSLDNVTYTFTGNINGTILVYRSDIILDGAGYTIYGNGSNEGITNYHGLSLDNVTVRNVNVEDVYRGIFFTGSSNLRIIGNNITNAANIGIHVHESSDCEVSDNYLESISLGNPPNGAGINIEWLSDRNIVIGNTIANSEQGVMVNGFCHGSIVSQNNISDCYRGIQLSNDVSYGNVTWNRIIRNQYGIDTGGYNPCVNNSIYGNTLMDNEYGLYFPSFMNNIISHNQFINNTYHAFDPYNSSVNIWDHDGEGNYWDDYTIRYPNATKLNGIWDTPYAINDDNIDDYPIIPEFPSFLLLLLFMVVTGIVIPYRERSV